MTKKRAIFFDRDGVLIFDVGYLSDPKKIIILPDVLVSLSQLKALGFTLIVISNQSGVARNFFDLQKMLEIDKIFKGLLNKEEKLIDDAFYCPHHPEFDKICKCRKPEIGMVKEAVKKYNINPKKSFFIGDKKEDIICGKAAGCKTILIRKNVKKFAEVDFESIPDFTANNLTEAVNWISRNS